MLPDPLILRRELHMHPELSGEEQETAQRIAGWLHEWGGCRIISGLGGHGLAAVYEGSQPGPALLFRAELDALPIAEENDFTYRSRIKDVAHKCGHDGHMAVLLAFAQRLVEQPPACGKVILLFQPAEESGEGAMQVLKDPAFKPLEPDWAFSFHNLPGYPLHQLVWREGPFTAAARSLIIRLRGKTSHAAEPENGINPAEAIAELIQFLGRLKNEDLASNDFALITPIYIHMGDKAYGTSAGEGELHLTIRTWTEKNMKSLTEKLEKAVTQTARKYGLEYELEWLHVFHTNRNDKTAVDIIRKAAHSLGYEQWERKVPMKWGEDFGAFSQRFKGAMFGIGAGKNCPALHNPDYDFPDEIIETGANLFEEIMNLILNPKS
jgi:amidohydrolase